MWRKSGISLLVLVLVSLPLFSFSPVRDSELLEASPEKLIRIIKAYENSLIQIEIEQENLNQIWKKERQQLEEEKTLLKEDKNLLIESEASLTMRNQLLEKSLTLQSESRKENFWDGFIWGAAAGSVIGGGLGSFAGSR